MIAEKNKVFVTMIGTEPGSGRGGISTAMEMFGKCFNKSGVEYGYLSVHSSQQGRLENMYTFIKCFPTLIKLRFSLSKKDKYLYLHVGPKGSLFRKLFIATVGRGMGFKVISHYHSPAFEGYLNSSGVMYYALKIIFLFSNKNLVLTKWWAQLFSSHGLNGTEVIPNCLECVDFHDRDNIVEEKVWMFSMGRLIPEKNFSAVIESLKYLPSRVSLCIGGDGAFRKDLERYAKELKVNERVFFLGWVNDDEKYFQLSRASVFALPSQYDSFGMVFIESLAMGCPVVTGPNPAVISALDGLERVLIADSYSGESLATSIREALSRKNSKVMIREAVMKKYGVSIVSDKLKKVFIDE